MIDKLIDPLLKNIDGLTNKFTEKNVNDEELKKKIDIFFENSKKLFQEIDKADKSQFFTKFPSLFGVISGFLGIGGVTAIGATGCWCHVSDRCRSHFTISYCAYLCSSTFNIWLPCWCFYFILQAISSKR